MLGGPNHLSRASKDQEHAAAANDVTTRIRNNWLGGYSFQSLPVTWTSLLPTAVAMNQKPIQSPRYRLGASFEVSDRPIGLTQSSATVRRA